MFHRLFKQLEFCQKSLRIVFSTLFSVFGYLYETLSLMFDILHEILSLMFDLLLSTNVNLVGF